MHANETILYESGTHKCIMFCLDEDFDPEAYISANHYLIINGDEAILVDPGSHMAYDDLIDAVGRHINIKNIKYIFLSHQDPDVSDSLPQWAICTKAQFIVSKIWKCFLSHYGIFDFSRIIGLEDHGQKIKFGNAHIELLPAHFLHSPGQFSLYDERSKILFSGDIGASSPECPDNSKRLDSDFETHKNHMLSFHRRFMTSNKACRAWVRQVEKREINCIAPQHGLLFNREKIGPFLNWFKELKCGLDLLDELYQ